MARRSKLAIAAVAAAIVASMGATSDLLVDVLVLLEGVSSSGCTASACGY